MKEILKELNRALPKRIIIEANEKLEEDSFKIKLSHMAPYVCCGASCYPVGLASGILQTLVIWGGKKEPSLVVQLKYGQEALKRIHAFCG